MAKTIFAITDITSRSIRLNSSKEDQQPQLDIPTNNCYIILTVSISEQFITIQNNPMAFDGSLTLSVLPVPAGPDGQVPSLSCSAAVMVIQHFSVSGVITNRVVAPRYSNPYSKMKFT